MITKNAVAASIPFDNTVAQIPNNPQEVQAAIEELKTNQEQSASPGFSFGRSGNVVAGAYLLNESVPSNKSGRRVSLNNAEIIQIWTNNEDITTYTIELYSHDGNEVNLSLLTSITVTADTANTITVSVPIAYGKQIAAKLSNGSAKNVLLGFIIKGSLNV